MSTKNSGAYLESQNRALIHIVKSHDWIFSKEKRYTYNEERRGELWQQISMALATQGFSLPDPKTRWKQLRDQFTRHDKNGNHNWLYYTDMHFMLHHICHKVKAPASLPQWPVSNNAGNQNPSSSSTVQLDMQGLGNRASNFEPFCQELPVLAIVPSTHPVENEVQLVEETVDHTQVPSSSSTLETYLQDLNWEHTYAMSPISSSAAAETLTVSSIPSPDCTTEENCTYRTVDIIEASMPSTSGNSVLHMDYDRTTPTNTCTKLIAISTSISTPHAEKLSGIALSGPSSTCKRASPLVATPMGHIHDTNDTHLLAEPSHVPTHSATPSSTCKRSSPLVATPRGHIHDTNDTQLVAKPSHVPTHSATPSSTCKRSSPLVATPRGHIHDTNDTQLVAKPSHVPTHFATPKTSKVGQRRLIVVPPMDAFAKKKKKEAGKSDTTEDAIIGCSKDLREMSSEFKDLLKMKKELIKAQLQEGRGEAEISKNRVESGDGFFNLLQEEWLDLPIETQDELFPDILDIMEEFEL